MTQKWEAEYSGKFTPSFTHLQPDREQERQKDSRIECNDNIQFNFEIIIF